MTNEEKKSFIKNTFYILIANVLILPISFFIRPLVARFVGPEQYGIFALILNTATIFSAITLLSLNSGVLYVVAKNKKNEEMIGSVISTSIISMFAISILLFIPLYILTQYLSPQVGFYGFLVSFMLGFSLNLSYVVQATEQGLEQFKILSLNTFITTALAGLFSVFAAYYFRDAYTSALGRTFGILIIALISFFILKKIAPPSNDILSKLCKYSLPLGIVGILGSFIVVVDRYALAFYKGSTEVAFFDISYSIVIAALPLINAIVNVMTPRIIEREHTLNSYYSKLSIITVLSLGFFAIGITYFSDIIISILLGKSYLPAIGPLRIVALALPLMGLYSLQVSSFNSINKTKYSSILSLALVIFSIMFNMILVPNLGSNGAAIANFLTYAIVVVTGWLALEKLKHIESGKTSILLLVFGVFWIVFPVLLPYGFVLKVFTFGLFCIFSYFTARKEFEEVLHQVPRNVF